MASRQEHRLCCSVLQTKKVPRLRVQFERTLTESYEFHRKARGIPQASTHGQTVGPSPHVALVPVLPELQLQSIPALPSPSLNNSRPGAKRGRVHVDDSTGIVAEPPNGPCGARQNRKKPATNKKPPSPFTSRRPPMQREKKYPAALHNRALSPLSSIKESLFSLSKRSTDAEEEENTDLQERFPVVCTLCGRILKIGAVYPVCSGPHRKKPWDRPVTSED